MDYNMDNIGRWVTAYYGGYERYMLKYYPELFAKFSQNIQPPQRIGGGIMIGRSARNTDEDYEEIMRISKEFCEKYENPINFPEHF